MLTTVNSRGDSGLRPYREILKRVVEFEICWENDQYKAKGLVASIREAVDKEDSFTRMKQERDERVSKQQAECAAAAEKRGKPEDINRRLLTLLIALSNIAASSRSATLSVIRL